MWVASSFGFFSIVRKPWGKKNKMAWLIRARRRLDLVNMVHGVNNSPADSVQVVISMDAIVKCTNADYPYRLVIRDGIAFTAIFDLLQRSCTYSNFKSEIAKTPDQQDKLDYYHDIWGTMNDYQHKRPARWMQMRFKFEHDEPRDLTGRERQMVEREAFPDYDPKRTTGFTQLEKEIL